MRNPRRMNTGLQNFNLGRMVNNSRNAGLDINALIDRKLNYRENAANIRKQTGMTTRNFGMDEFVQTTVEHERDRQRKNRERPYQSWRGIEMDMRLQALPPGRRTSRQGNRYYEKRNNRVDRSGTL